jgi:hypothetical protein
VVSFVVKQSLETSDSKLEVETQNPKDVSGESDLRPGVHRFMLTVEDDAGVQSEPVIAEIEVVGTRLPTDFAPGLLRVPPGIDNVRRKGKGGGGPAPKDGPGKKSKPGRQVKSTPAKKAAKKPAAKKTTPKR